MADSGMASSTVPAAGKDIATTLNYGEDDGTRHHFNAVTDPSHWQFPDIELPKTMLGGGTKACDVTVRDARQLHPPAQLDTIGFELVRQTTSLSVDDFYHEGQVDKIRSTYYAEMIETIKQATGAEHVHVFHHQVRNQPKEGESPPSVTEAGGVQGYAHGIHSDSCPRSADSLFLSLGNKPELERFKTGRYLYINAWRNIGTEPIADNHLGLLDGTSIDPLEDVMKADIFLPTGKSEQFKLNHRNVASHRWFYFPALERDEVILFKQWDSSPAPSARVCFHTAFRDPNAREDAPSRQSIEVRALAYFPPGPDGANTMPSKEPEAPKSLDGFKPAAEYVTRLTAACRAFEQWPPFAKAWARQQLVERPDAGIRGILAQIAADPTNRHGLRDAPKELHDQVLAGLLDTDVPATLLRQLQQQKKNKAEPGAWTGAGAAGAGAVTGAFVAGGALGLAVAWAALRASR